MINSGPRAFARLAVTALSAALLMIYLEKIDISAQIPHVILSQRYFVLLFQFFATLSVHAVFWGE
jgi:hypothetical protein